MSLKLIPTNKKKLYKCSICGTVDNWIEGWSYYGSETDPIEDKIIICPKEECRDKVADQVLKMENPDNAD